MNAMNAIGYERREAVARGASSAAVLPDGQSFRTGIGARSEERI
jgi:hypothetical protein